MRTVHGTLAISVLLPATISSQEGGIEVFAAAPLFANGTRVSISTIYESNAPT